MDLPDDDLPPRRGPLARVPVWAWVGGGLGLAGLIAVPAVAAAVWFLTAKPVPPDDPRPAGGGEVAAREPAPAPTGKSPAPKQKAQPKAAPAPAADLPTVPIDTIAEAYQLDRDAAEARYKGKRLRVEITVRKSGAGWVGTVAQLTPPQMRKMSAAQINREAQEAALRGWVPNVVFHVPNGKVDDHKRAVVEGTCAGIAPDASTGLKLTFTNARIVSQQQP
jgi:hypothetical protein